MKFISLLAALLFSVALSAHAAGDPTYKCITQGKVTYSDEPCVGAKIVDTTPTQGLDKTSGQSRKGADVQRVETQREMGKAMQQITGRAPEQRDKAIKRINLSLKDRQECEALDIGMVHFSTPTPEEEVELYNLRKRYKDLKC
ncbi:DUF4124 domain-containing protein [Polaromonas sp.]|uniref:DUF4124 domain-containing protein n=1 Tax=Polaromonas sp. TaxID=1869339 RepID=UPI0032637B07